MTKVLVANRGEIACRIFATAKRIGYGTVAVYSEPDAGARHVEMADEAVALGGYTASQSYLVIEAIIEAARQTGATLIHPGYGFLSENVDFAHAVTEAGLVFVGPPPEAVAIMGSKRRAKALMQQVGVPTLPGFHGADASDSDLIAAATEIGFPVLVKASAGGGGKGMRIVSEPAALAEALAAARRESQSAFGSGELIVEKYLQDPRHIEVQVFADSHGNVVHLFDRDCSVQRRHQKILEEAPAPGLASATRDAMAAAAIEAARAVDYVGAGTVEFLVDSDESFYFLEMNTRLQVEHGITELVTGQDLVEWQLEVAQGNALPRRQEELVCSGHAIEARLYAEDPQRDFLPTVGTIGLWQQPSGDRVRVDAGIRAGDVVSIHYDPLIAKVMAWGRDRAEALARLNQALDATLITGLETNREYLRQLTRPDGPFTASAHTGFVRLHPPEEDDQAIAPHAMGAAVALLANVGAEPGRPSDPWASCDGFRLNQTLARSYELGTEQNAAMATLVYNSGRLELCINGNRYPFEAQRGNDGSVSVQLADDCRELTAVDEGEKLIIFFEGNRFILRPRCRQFQKSADDSQAADGALRSPMPGTVTSLRVSAGKRVEEGQVLAVVEAMKMEHAIVAPAAGEVVAVHVPEGATLAEGDLVVTLATGAEAANTG